MQNMQEGAFALIDCLGFRGIWKRKDETLLLKKLRRVMSIMQQVHLRLLAEPPFRLLDREVIITPSLLSDSVAISLRYTRKQKDEKIKERRQKSYLIWLICASTIRVLDIYLKGEPNLVLRGCITYGKYEHKTNKTGSFIVGPAVDDAVANMEVSQGAFVWLLPEAAALYRYAVKIQQETIKILYRRNDKAELLEGSKQSLAKPLMVDSYEMPIKPLEGGGYLQCLVVNPLAFHDTEKKRKAVFKAYEEATSGNQLDVMLKRQNTMDFLKRANEARSEHENWYKEFIKSIEKS